MTTPKDRRNRKPAVPALRAKKENTMGDEPTLASIDKKIAVLCERVSHQVDQQTAMNAKFDKHLEKSDVQINELKVLINQADDCAKDAQAKAQVNKEEIDRLRGKSNIIDTLLFVATIVLGALGIDIKP